jgi:hypothetical protein
MSHEEMIAGIFAVLNLTVIHFDAEVDAGGDQKLMTCGDLVVFVHYLLGTSDSYVNGEHYFGAVSDAPDAQSFDLSIWNCCSVVSPHFAETNSCVELASGRDTEAVSDFASDADAECFHNYSYGSHCCAKMNAHLTAAIAAAAAAAAAVVFGALHSAVSFLSAVASYLFFCFAASCVESN